MFSRRRWTGLTVPTLLMSAALLSAALAAQAQSSYTLTTLRSPNSLGISPLRLDNQNNVLGNAYYATVIDVAGRKGTSIPLFGGLATYYTSVMSTWLAGTGSTVSPRRLTSDFFEMTTASQNGRYVGLRGRVYTVSGGRATLYSSSYLDTIDGVQVTAVDSGNQARTLSDRGNLATTVILFDGPAAGLRRATWWEGATPVGRFMALGDFLSSHVISISPDEVVAGYVYPALPGAMRGAIWKGGALQVLEQQPGRGSAAHQVNAAGQVLACVGDARLNTVTYGENDSVTTSVYSRLRPVVFSAGQEREVQAPVAGLSASARAMNAQGTVVGRYGTARAPSNLDSPSNCNTTDLANVRAFIWRDGVSTDLNTWVASKGVKLPTGAVLVDAIDINDQGSILAAMVTNNRNLSHVRLNARP
jgi:hypothetical protein